MGDTNIPITWKLNDHKKYAKKYILQAWAQVVVVLWEHIPKYKNVVGLTIHVKRVKVIVIRIPNVWEILYVERIIAIALNFPQIRLIAVHQYE